MTCQKPIERKLPSLQDSLSNYASEYQTAIEGIKKQISEVKKDNVSHQQKIATLEKELASQRGEKDALIQDKEKLKKEKEELAEELADCEESLQKVWR